MLCHNLPSPGLPDHAFPILNHDQTNHNMKPMEHWCIATVVWINQLLKLWLNPTVSKQNLRPTVYKRMVWWHMNTAYNTSDWTEFKILYIISLMENNLWMHAAHCDWSDSTCLPACVWLNGRILRLARQEVWVHKLLSINNSEKI